MRHHPPYRKVYIVCGLYGGVAFAFSLKHDPVILNLSRFALSSSFITAMVTFLSVGSMDLSTMRTSSGKIPAPVMEVPGGRTKNVV